MLDTWLWHYPAKKAGLVTIFFTMLGSIKVWVYSTFVIGELQPSYIIIAFCLVGVGTGCILLVYHAQKNGDEDTAAKKILLIGLGVAILLIPLVILDTLYLTPFDDVVWSHQEVIPHTQPLS